VISAVVEGSTAWALKIDGCRGDEDGLGTMIALGN
jgi:hypothetical protein